MTALEVCDYFNIACHGDYHIKMKEAATQMCNKITFWKLLNNNMVDSRYPAYTFDVNGETCDSFVRFVTRHNLENYEAFSWTRSYRYIDYDDIRVDSINKVVWFI